MRCIHRAALAAGITWLFISYASVVGPGGPLWRAAAETVGSAHQPRVQLGAPTIDGALQPNIVRRIVRAHVNELAFCYQEGLSNDPHLAGDLLVEFTVSPRGTVTRSRIARSSLGDVDVESCMTAAFARWRFPEPDDGQPARARQPVALSPG